MAHPIPKKSIPAGRTQTLKSKAPSSPNDVEPVTKRRRTNTSSSSNSSSTSILSPQTSGDVLTAPPFTIRDCVARAKLALSPGVHPDFCPGRLTEFNDIGNVIFRAIQGQHGTAVYVCGSPGSGKTITVKRVVVSLMQYRNENKTGGILLENNDCSLLQPTGSPNLTSNNILDTPTAEIGLPPFKVIQFNANGVNKSSLYEKLADGLGIYDELKKNKKLGKMKSAVIDYFRKSAQTKKGSKAHEMTLLVIDEIDLGPKEEIRELLILARKQELVDSEDGRVVRQQNSSSLIMIGLANNIGYPAGMGLPAYSSPIIFVFKPYTQELMKEILISRTFSLFSDVGLTYLSKKLVKDSGKSYINVCVLYM